MSKNTSVIIAYHPAIFKGLQSFTLSNPLQSSLLQCASFGISVYSPHTALDSVWGGINDWLAEGLMKSNDDGEIRGLVREKLNEATGECEGAEGRLVILKEPIEMATLEGRIKSHLKLAQSTFFFSFWIFHLSSVFGVFFSPGWVSSTPRRHIIVYSFNSYLRWLWWRHACWPKCRCIPYRRNVTCQSFLTTMSCHVAHLGP